MRLTQVPQKKAATMENMRITKTGNHLVTQKKENVQLQQLKRHKAELLNQIVMCGTEMLVAATRVGIQNTD